MIRIIVLAAVAAVLLTIPAVSQPPRASNRPAAPPPTNPPKTAPRLVPMAETKLLMEGLTNANYLGLERILKGSDIDAESWAFARGQALLIAESGNLLMMRPPKNAGQDAWMKSAGELRDSAGQLGRAIAGRDLDRSRVALIDLSTTCNACHESFRVDKRIKPFGPDKP